MVSVKFGEMYERACVTARENDRHIRERSLEQLFFSVRNKDRNSIISKKFHFAQSVDILRLTRKKNRSLFCKCAQGKASSGSNVRMPAVYILKRFSPLLFVQDSLTARVIIKRRTMKRLITSVSGKDRKKKRKQYHLRQGVAK